MTHARYQLLIARRPRPPFLLWPVSRREFYRAIWVALFPSLAWGIILFGVRPLEALIASTAAATFSHVLIKRILKWSRGQYLLYHHSLLSATIFVALARPSWPVWILASVSFLLPIFLALLRGPGRERIHLAIVAVFLLQYALIPSLPSHFYTGSPDAILARDRLVMGDIDVQTPANAETPQFLAPRAWPTSLDLGGNDAFPFPPPAAVAARTFGEISHVLEASPPPPPVATTPPGLISPLRYSDIQLILDRAFVFGLPSMDTFILGAAPNRFGLCSLIGVTIAGLYLSYRYILRPRSLSLFLGTFILVSVLLAFTPDTIHRTGILTLWQVICRFPAQFATLLIFLIFNSDAPFAAVFILALPGTEPLTARGRFVFLVLAAILAATLHRLDPLTPSATFALTLLMPAAPLFDRLLARNSWLNSPADSR